MINRAYKMFVEDILEAMDKMINNVRHSVVLHT